jgi:hypothetical protein
LDYRARIEAAIRSAMTEYVHGLSREFEEAIDDRAARMKGALLGTRSAEYHEIYDDLLNRARNLRELFDHEAHRRAMPEDRGSPVDSSSTAARNTRVCPICYAVVQAIFDSLSNLQYELSTVGDAQREHAETGGFCPVHTWLYANLTSPLAVSRAYPAVLKARVAELNNLGRTAGTIEELSRGVGDSSSLHPMCKVCATARTARDRAIAEMLNGLAVSDKQGPPALCLPHLRLALRCCADLKSGRELVRECGRALSRVADDMRRYALKRDAIRQNLTNADERDAYQLGLTRLAGDRRLGDAQSEDDRL